ncbi:MAG: Holliday junction resolvase RuvX [bacterium]
MSDALGMYAHPRQAIRVRSLPESVKEIARIIRDDSIEEVIVGLPLTLAGERGFQAATNNPLVAALRAAVSIPVREVDERLSSAQAVSMQPNLGGKRDGTLDSASAAVVLQAVLDSRRRSQR